MRITVDKHCINEGAINANNGTLNIECWCPVALAIKKTLPEAKSVFVSEENVSITPAKGESLYINLPESVRKFIANFDGNRKVAPFAFNLVGV